MQKPGPAAKNETEYLRNQKKNDDGEIKLQFNLQLNKWMKNANLVCNIILTILVQTAEFLSYVFNKRLSCTFLHNWNSRTEITLVDNKVTPHMQFIAYGVFPKPA